MAIKLNIKTPREFINPLLAKKSIDKTKFDIFKEQLENLKLLNQKESEEHQKNSIRDFLHKSFDYILNTKGRIDLAIFQNHIAEVIIEAKSLDNKTEMINQNELNHKAFSESIKYFMDERKEGNNNLKHIVILTAFEWFIFDAKDYEKLFWQDKDFRKIHDSYNNPNSLLTKTGDVYEEIKKLVENKKSTTNLFEELEIKCAYFNFKTGQNATSEKELTSIYKLLSSDGLLKEFNPNDANSLNREFYNELLYILGLEEIKNGSKKLISQSQKPQIGSFYENISDKLSQRDKANDFETIIRLIIIWVNRILFLKLLESQIVTWNKNGDYKFLNHKKIVDFDALENLFFDVLAKKLKDRTHKEFDYIPYLNSSLFEFSQIENEYISISNLSDDAVMEYYSRTVIRDANSNKKTGEVSTLSYLFEFLDAYDFGSSDSEDIFSSHGKTLINASVLGLIFEKINGYKDGSFYTPSFITMYMARESLQKSILDKFNHAFEDLEANSWHELVRYSDKHSHKDEFVKNANSIIDSITICDPAVGSGHFLVSALNEIIYIKYQLGLYAIRGLDIKLENDELIVSLHDEWFNYIKPKSFDNDNHKVQKLLFTEKQRIIENQLFGVDINPNSAQITKLRLWIELLKNSYYDENYQLVTLPNIDINIKTGNSLISRFGLSDNLGKNIKNEVEQYKSWVELYKKTSDKDIKHNVLESISELKKSYSTRLHEDSPKIIKLKGLVDKYIAEFGFDGINDNIILYAKKEYIFLYSKDPTFKPQGLMGEHVSKLDKNKLNKEIKSLYDDVDSINKGKIYENAFEWRFEFPEVLDENGEFIGFDIVIGNPPYIKEYEGKHIFDGLRENEVYQGKMDIWYMFVADGLKILNKHGALNFIAPNNWTTNSGASKIRDYILQNSKIIQLIDFNNYMIFEEASIQTMIMQFEKQNADNYTFDYRRLKAQKPIFEDVVNLFNSIESENIEILKPQVSIKNHLNKTLTFNNNENEILLNKIKEKQNFHLDEKSEIAQGIVFPQDFINKTSNDKLNQKFQVGDGIFGLSETEKNNLNLTEKELELVKPYFISEQFSRYYANPNNNLWLIYTSSKFKNIDAILPYPNIKNHLDKFQDVITSDNKPYGLHRAREENFFKGEKIIVQRKCAVKPVFTYADFDTYVSATFYVIKTSRLNQKYLVALLNSKLIEFWLKNKGKMQGNNYQLDKEPLLDIPLCVADERITNKIADIVEKILNIKKEGKDTAELEAKIDTMVYELYGLSEDEITILEKI